MLKKISLILLALLVFLSSCQNGNDSRHELRRWLTPNDKIKVLSTTKMIGDLVEKVGGKHVDSIVLIRGQLDPHSYQMVKGDDEKLNFADLIFYNGLGLEHGPSLQYVLVQKPNAVPLGEQIYFHYPEKILMVGNRPDPHIWMDVSLWAETVPFIVQALSQYDPEHRKEYEDNGKKLIEEMMAVHRLMKSKLHTVPDEKRYLVTSHDAFNYFARAYLAAPDEVREEDWDPRFEAPEGLAPESQLSTNDIHQILSHLQTYQIEVLFPESNVSQDSLRKILSAGIEMGMDLVISTEPLYGDAMGVDGSSADTYLKMMKKNAETISKYLNGNHE